MQADKLRNNIDMVQHDKLELFIFIGNKFYGMRKAIFLWILQTAVLTNSANKCKITTTKKLKWEVQNQMAKLKTQTHQKTNGYKVLF